MTRGEIMSILAVFMVLNSDRTALAQNPQGLYAKISAHCTQLSKESNPVANRHLEAQKELVKAIVEKIHAGEKVDVLMICTGNSRRSMMGAAMGNGAAAFHHLSGVRFYSGGTAPSAFNSRSIKALSEIGFVIDATGEKASPGPKGEENPVYQVRWGNEKALQIAEFSKHYADAHNPRKGFIALMVCDEADKGCPMVVGASKRISLPYADPKEFDGTALESAKYAERRDDLGRFMLSTMAMVRERVQAKGK